MTEELDPNKINTHTISLFVTNKPGVLVRVALVFARRGFNIDALVVSSAYDPQYSRITITAQGDPHSLEQIIKQTSKLIDVVHVFEHTDKDAVHRELALFKIKNTKSSQTLITSVKKKFNISTITEGKKVLIVEQSGTTEELDAFESMIKKQNVIEMVRSGKIVIALSTEET